MNLGHFEVGLPVKDLQRSVAFYEKVGFAMVGDTLERRFATMQKDSCRFTLYEGHLDPDRPQLTFWQGDVAAIRTALEAEGLEVGKSKSDNDGGRSMMLKDPDGHPLFFINLPGVQQVAGAV